MDDEDGISEAGYFAAREMAQHIASRLEKEAYLDDIFDAVKATNGRYYLPEDHGLSRS